MIRKLLCWMQGHEDFPRYGKWCNCNAMFGHLTLCRSRATEQCPHCGKTRLMPSFKRFPLGFL